MIKEDFIMGKKIPLWQTILVMLVMIGLLVWSIVKDAGGEPHIALILAASFAGIIACLNGWKWAYLEQGILASINRSMQAILILAILGAIIASWMAAGTIPSMMYYGIKIISPKVFLVTACILCSIVSLATGSSWSTAGSMGVALMGVGAALGFPPAMTAGAVVADNLEKATLPQEAEVGGETVLDVAAEVAEEEADITISGEDAVAESAEAQYANLVIAKCNDYVNVRQEPSEEAEIVGKLYNKSVGDFVSEADGGWYQITSGSVTGYVKAEYCVTGEAAIALAKEVGNRIATVTTTTLFVREEPTVDSAVLGMVGLEDDLSVLQEDELDGWVKVPIEEGEGYVSTEFVELHTEFVKAESKAEEEARLAKEEAERKAANAAASKKSGKSSSGSGSSASVSGGGAGAF